MIKINAAIRTAERNCVHCNKCISHCPVDANKSFVDKESH